MNALEKLKSKRSTVRAVITKTIHKSEALLNVSNLTDFD